MVCAYMKWHLQRTAEFMMKISHRKKKLSFFVSTFHLLWVTPYTKYGYWSSTLNRKMCVVVSKMPWVDQNNSITMQGQAK